MRASRRGLTIATHNILDGLRLSSLLDVYNNLRTRDGLHALCVQEAVPHAATRIARALGPRFAVGEHAGAPRLSIVYDRSVLTLRRLHVLSLQRLDHVPLLQRLYTSCTPETKQALIARFTLRGHGRALTVANFHLDTAGYNAHRKAQVRSLSNALSTRLNRPLIACGDTNAFVWYRSEAEPALRKVLAPLLHRHSAVDVHAHKPVDTHFFARANEPKLGQQLAVAFGKLGVDFPRRYDVIAASSPCFRAGVVDTTDSDHNLVYATLDVHRRLLGSR